MRLNRVQILIMSILNLSRLVIYEGHVACSSFSLVVEPHGTKYDKNLKVHMLKLPWNSGRFRAHPIQPQTFYSPWRPTLWYYDLRILRSLFRSIQTALWIYWITSNLTYFLMLDKNRVCHVIIMWLERSIKSEETEVWDIIHGLQLWEAIFMVLIMCLIK